MDIASIVEIARQTSYAMTPLVLAAVGEIVTEKAGVVNIGLEGIMLLSAFIAVYVAEITGGPWLGVVAGTVLGAFMGVIHGIISNYLKGDQIISGLGINLLALGLVPFGIEAVWKVRGYHTVPPEAKVPPLPYIQVSPIFFLTILITILTYYMLNKTNYGRKIRAVGENPEAADVVGINVEFVQTVATIYGAALAGLAGAFLSIDWLSSITKNLSAGRGFIALALVNFANWNPLLALIGGVLFGAAWTGAEWLKIIPEIKALIPVSLLNTLPYIATLVVVAGFIGVSRPPAHIGRPYKRE